MLASLRIPRLALAALTLAAAACDDVAPHADLADALRRGGTDAPASALTSYGAPAPLGNGRVRAYVTVDANDPDKPLELGVTLTPGALEGLPAPKPKADGHGAHGASAPHSGHEQLDSHTQLLDLPGRNPTPFQFVQLDWNPAGHEPPGIYDLPHFDFHFWTASKDVRAQIVPDHPEFERRASGIPPREFWIPQFADAATAANLPASKATVPLMGLHWFDVRSPELQGVMGKPELAQPFTKTFIYGSWDSRFVFLEPMITRAYILAKRAATDPAVRDEIIPVSVPARAQVGGYYPTAYRIAWDEAEQVFRIALVNFRRVD